MFSPTNNHNTNLLKYRVVLGFFIFALIVSGVTAFPLEREIELLVSVCGADQDSPIGVATGFNHWILVVRDGLRESYGKFPWLAYGTDWLAFAHIIIAIFFIGPLIDPVRNVWVLKAGIIACVLVIPLALLCGYVRHIPFGWRLIDCSFGVFGLIPLIFCLHVTRKLSDAKKLD